VDRDRSNLVMMRCMLTVNGSTTDDATGSVAGVSAPAEVARRLFSAYAVGDSGALRSILDDDLIAYVTNADADIDVVNGRAAYLERLPDLAATGGSLDVTQVVEVEPSGSSRWSRSALSATK
jgi:ketosteroid isomerase-like protein